MKNCMSVHKAKYVFKFRRNFLMSKLDEIYYQDNCSEKVVPIF